MNKLLLVLSFFLLVSTSCEAKTVNAIISSGQSQSSIIDMGTLAAGDGSVLTLYIPSAWTTANLTVLTSPNGKSPWYNANSLFFSRDSSKF